ncbi:10 kDa chaperonin [Trifolium pratense]|uniref:10 kDa chaperonin n=3 Tax=Trifolium pratense TaxID=57577 RepID=A0A2K3N899_TRIPR|nr:10 kDa chaperonin 1, chloroplastic-like [Trifolium pratense]PNX99271.1 10 kDa chaperonin [Trifolium pratense]
MASTFLTIPTPFLHKTTTASFSNRKLPLLKRNSLKVNAIANKWEPTKVVPQADRVLIRLEELSQQTAGGILLPKSAVKFERYLVGEVLNVGAEAENVKAGAKVLFNDVNAYEVDLGTDAKHVFIKSSDLLAVVE